MKLKKNIFEKYNFSHTNIINIKSYLSFLKQSNKLKLLNFESSFQSLKTIELNLKKVLKIIFEFHKLNKNIVFVGFPDINSYKFSLLFNKFNYKFLKKNQIKKINKKITLYGGKKRTLEAMRNPDVD